MAFKRTTTGALSALSLLLAAPLILGGEPPAEADPQPATDHRTNTEYIRIGHMSVPFGHTFAGTNDPSDPDWGFFGLGLAITGPTFRFEHFYVSAADFAVFMRTETGLFGVMGGVRVGTPWFLDSAGKHEIDFGLGVEFGTMHYSMGGDYARYGGGLGLILSPSVGYSFATDSSVVIGPSIRTFIITPASSDFDGWVIAGGLGLDVAFR